MATLTSDPTLGTTSTIGRYFGIVSVVPSLFFGIWTYLLFASRPWQGPPDLSAIAATSIFESVTIGMAVILLSLVLAVVTHPLQFFIVQLFEGYWGSSPLGLAWQERRVMAHLQRRHRLVRMSGQAGLTLVDLKRAHGLESVDDEIDWSEARERGRIEALLTATLKEHRANMALGGYPQEYSDTMPTRLGNILRRYEASAGGAVDLDLVTWATHIGMVAEATHTAYVQDQRNDMDLAVRMSATSLALFVLTFLLLWPHGWWLLTALIPLAAAYLSYRGAVVTADSYGRALVAWLHLNRFRLYEALHLPRAGSADEERDQNGVLEDLASGSPDFEIQYEHRESPGAAQT